jgi:hypothetical protein
MEVSEPILLPRLPNDEDFHELNYLGNMRREHVAVRDSRHADLNRDGESEYMLRGESEDARHTLTGVCSRHTVQVCQEIIQNADENIRLINSRRGPLMAQIMQAAYHEQALWVLMEQKAAEIGIDVHEFL